MIVTIQTQTIFHTRGRNPELQKARNTRIIQRFYYWFETEGKRIEKAYTNVGNEFFLSPRTVENIVQANQEELDALYRSPTPTLPKREGERTRLSTAQ